MNGSRSLPTSIGKAAFIAVLLTGCGANRGPFRPADQALASSQQGYSAAVYEVITDRGHWGQVRVWSRGIRYGQIKEWEADRSNGRIDVETAWRKPGVHVGFMIVNKSSGPLRLALERTQVELIVENGSGITLTEEALTMSAVEIPRGAERRIELRFALPTDFPRDDVDAYNVMWTIQAAHGKFYSRTTAFVRTTSPGPTGFEPYDPFYGSPDGTTDPNWPYPAPRSGIRFGTVQD